MSDAPLTRLQAAAVAIYAYTREIPFEEALPRYRALAERPTGSDDMKRHFEDFAAFVLAAADKAEGLT